MCVVYTWLIAIHVCNVEQYTLLLAREQIVMFSCDVCLDATIGMKRLLLNYPRSVIARKPCFVKTRILGYCSEYLQKKRKNDNWVFRLLRCLFERLKRAKWRMYDVSIKMAIYFSKWRLFFVIVLLGGFLHKKLTWLVLCTFFFFV